ncbi:Outer membrane receptor for ferrienterochelin and colicins [Desulforhopalus singaporensis]|uniref:Outer membrane receptor for ferrienterochelin and colicins n=2 Tax=Desulforhopalus singaporensis TaxID=91360 RepID=A0A1H0RMJ3_9BACT|nr:Outer membrane receptor for ferrienterochelin and colicins [Desulforhopalus singaporensis]
MKKVLWAGACLALAAGSQSVVLAETANQEEGAYRIGEIVVAAASESVVEQAGTVYRVTAEQIRKQNAKNLDQALELVPGLVVREGAEGTPRIDIRGFRTRHVQLFINGIPVKSSYDGQFDPTRIPAEIISEIKVTSGGGSVLYGAGGNGGAIDIITKLGTAEGLHGLVGGEVGEGGSYTGKGGVWGSGGKLDFYAHASVQNRDEFLLSDDFVPVNVDAEDGGDRENSDREQKNLFGNLSYNLNDDNTLGFTLSRFDGENGKPPATNYDPSDPFAKKTSYERIDDSSNTLLQAAFSHDSSSPLDIRGWAYYSLTSEEENGYDDDSYSSQRKNGSFFQDSDTETFGVSTQVRYAVNDFSGATLAASAENESWEAEGFEIDKDGNPGDLASDHDLQTYSVALEYENQLADGLGIVAGYGHHFNERDEGSDNDFSYVVGATYDVSEATQLRVNHARKIRFPSVKQLYGKDGNEDLETEVTYHYEAGISQKMWTAGTLDVTGFIIDAEDFIEKIDTGGKDQNVNFQELSLAGVEANLTLTPLEKLMIRLGISYLDTEDQSEGSAREELQYRPEWKLSVDGSYTLDCGFSVYGSVLHARDQYYYDSKQEQKGELDDFTLVNLKLSQDFQTTGIEVYVAVDNLFDEDYEESYGLPQPGRMVYGGLEYRF